MLVLNAEDDVGDYGFFEDTLTRLYPNAKCINARNGREALNIWAVCVWGKQNYIIWRHLNRALQYSKPHILPDNKLIATENETVQNS
jgi:hypothetical protein